MKVFSEAVNSLDQNAIEANSRLRANLAGVRSIVAFGSARGGVGKSALAVNIAASLALARRKVGLVDGDLNSPTVLSMLGMKPPRRMLADTIEPGAGPLGLRIAASNLLPDIEPPPISFLEPDLQPAELANGHATGEPGYLATLRRLLGQTRFGALDTLLIDLAPGVENIHRIAAVLPRTALVLVSQSSELAARAARSALTAVGLNSTAVLGIVENMAGFNCDGCHTVRPLVPQGGLGTMAREVGVPIIERLPFDPRLAETCDRGVLFIREYPDTPLAKQIAAIANTIAGAAPELYPAESPQLTTIGSK
jgi:ATP-binding protein involved in chromosome partitioning